MTEQELREKIINTIKENGVYNGKSMHRDYYVVNDEELADAIIAAGIGDVETVQNISASATAIAVLEAAQAKHRAKVAESALLTACVNLIKDKQDNVNMELLARVVYTNYLRKAEKELAEE